MSRHGRCVCCDAPPRMPQQCRTTTAMRRPAASPWLSPRPCSFSRGGRCEGARATAEQPCSSNVCPAVKHPATVRMAMYELREQPIIKKQGRDTAQNTLHDYPTGSASGRNQQKNTRVHAACPDGTKCHCAAAAHVGRSGANHARMMHAAKNWQHYPPPPRLHPAAARSLVYVCTAATE